MNHVAPMQNTDVSGRMAPEGFALTPNERENQE